MIVGCDVIALPSWFIPLLTLLRPRYIRAYPLLTPEDTHLKLITQLPTKERLSGATGIS